MNIFILDGYNVIYAVPRLKARLDRSLESAREALLAACHSILSRRGDISKITIVFDGDERFAYPGAQGSGPVSVLFTPRKEEADDRILAMIRRDAGKSRFIIVSNDNYVFNNCRAHGARVMSVSDFFSETALKEKKPHPRESGSGSKDLAPDKARRITDEYRKHLGY